MPADPEPPPRVITDETRSRLRGFARSIMSPQLRQKHDSESVVQSVEAAAARNDEIWADPEKLLPLLFMMTRNKVLDRVKRETAQKRDMRREAGPVDAEIGASEALDPQAAAEWADFWAHVRESLGPLGSEYLQILDCLEESRSTEETAAMLRLSQRTVQRRIKVVGEVVRRALGEPGDAPAA